LTTLKAKSGRLAKLLAKENYIWWTITDLNTSEYNKKIHSN